MILHELLSRLQDILSNLFLRPFLRRWVSISGLNSIFNQNSDSNIWLCFSNTEMSYKERSTCRSCDAITKIDLEITIKKCTDIRIEYKNQSKTENDLCLLRAVYFSYLSISSSFLIFFLLFYLNKSLCKWNESFPSK